MDDDEDDPKVNKTKTFDEVESEDEIFKRASNILRKTKCRVLIQEKSKTSTREERQKDNNHSMMVDENTFGINDAANEEHSNEVFKKSDAKNSNSENDLIDSNAKVQKHERQRSHAFPNKKKCVLCDFENIQGDSAGAWYTMFNHYIKHFQEKINTEIKQKLPTTRPFKCPDCDFTCKSKMTPQCRAGILKHYLNKHDVMKNYIDEAVKEKQKQEVKAGEMENAKVSQTKTNNEFESENEEFEKVDEDDDDNFSKNCHPYILIKICALCSFVNPVSKNRQQKMFKMFEHYKQHFQAKINSEIMPKIPTSRPFQCPNCKLAYPGYTALLNHYINQHDVLKNYINEATKTQEVEAGEIENDKVNQTKTNTEFENTDNNFTQKAIPEKKFNTKSCVLCEYKGSNNSIFMHYINEHFQARIDSEIKPNLPSAYPFKCPDCSNFDINYIKNCNWVQDISKAKFELLSHYLRKHNVMEKYIGEALEEKRQKENFQEESNIGSDAGDEILNPQPKRIEIKDKKCLNCNRPKDNDESVCIDCLDHFVLVKNKQHKCSLCKKEFPSLSETYQHIDLVHSGTAQSGDSTDEENVEENIVETKEETTEEFITKPIEETTTTIESIGKKLCPKKIGPVHPKYWLFLEIVFHLAQ